MVWQVLDMLKAGASARDIIKSYPSLNDEMIEEALGCAAQILRAEHHVRFT